MPIPPTAAPTYKAASELAEEFRTQARATRIAPPSTTQRGPAVDEVAFGWDQPGFDQYENRKGDLDMLGSPMVFGINGIDEQRPPILQIRNAGYADDADGQLDPWVCKNRPRRQLWLYILRYSPLYN